MTIVRNNCFYYCVNGTREAGWIVVPDSRWILLSISFTCHISFGSFLENINFIHIITLRYGEQGTKVKATKSFEAEEKLVHLIAYGDQKLFERSQDR